MIHLLKILAQLNFLSPSNLGRLGRALRQNGVNLMLLFALTEKTGGNKTALVDSRETVSYGELQKRCDTLARHLAEQYGLEKGRKTAFFCKNHASLVSGIFAVSRLGADVFLLNSSMSQLQFDRLVKEHDFDFLVYDAEFSGLIENSSYQNPKLASYHETEPAVSTLSAEPFSGKLRLPPASSGKIVLLTGGTTGKPKQVIHRPSLFNFLQPFSALLNRLQLPEYKTAYIATPIYHGYGIAVLLSFFALGKKVVIQDSFDAKRACALIHEHHVEVATVVPLMVHKMLNANKEDLRSLACIASGGAKLNPALVEEVNHHLGGVLYNLYGTSEAGLNIIAAPADLQRYPNTLGRLIDGGRLRVMRDGDEVEPGSIGEFCFRNKWSMQNNKNRWIRTGDIGYRNQEGFYFLCGRTDDLIVSAGNNIYPLEIEGALMHHPSVGDAAVIGVDDVYGGQILTAYVQLRSGEQLTAEALVSWMRTRVAGFQVPREIIFVEELPYTAVGKLDRKRVQGLVEKSATLENDVSLMQAN